MVGETEFLLLAQETKLKKHAKELDSHSGSVKLVNQNTLNKKATQRRKFEF